MDIETITMTILGPSEKGVKEEIQLLKDEVTKMSDQLNALNAQMAALVAEVQRNTTVESSAIAAIQGLVSQQQVLSQQLADAIVANDPVAVQAAADGIAAQVSAMSTSADALAAAIPVVG